MLKGKKVILGVTGSVAAYKSAILIRNLVKQGVEVKVVMTPLAKEFITPLSLATLSRNSVLVDFFNPENDNGNNLINLNTWADAYIIAPATANTIGKMANGIADNVLLALYLSVRCPVFVAPAMNADMYFHHATRKNIKELKSRGNHIIEPIVGELASGLEGKGHMEEPEMIVDYLEAFFEPKHMLGKKILVTAGPTYERIDPVRFIGNYSSGKMGFAIAETCAKQGAEVVLVSGPVSAKIKNKSIKQMFVESAEEMYKVVMNCFEQMDGAILNAAVTDFTPVHAASAKKLKHSEENLILELKPARDIAAALGKIKKPEQFLVGFALETDNEERNAIDKMTNKNLDFIVLNSLNNLHTGFGFDKNKVSIIHRSGLRKDYELKSKLEVAADILNEVNTLIF
jgi:phosphopantothenoylcysteine decarboxylase/phosphopantothenate--cysteine ligase, prokaryotic